MSVVRKLGIRRTMTPNQVVAYNVAKARALRGWTQEQAAEVLAPYLGAKLSGASFSALERSAWTINRIKVFSADELLALSRGFDLPIGYFFTPPPPDTDIALHAPDGPWPGLDPIVLLDAILGRPDNLGHWEKELLAYSAAVAPAPANKRETPHVSPSDLADRVDPLVALRAKALVRLSLGDVAGASEVLARLAEALRDLDEPAQDDTGDGAAPDDTTTARGRRARRPPPAKKG